MSSALDPNDITAPDPNDYTYVSIKNWNRKQTIISGNNDSVNNLIGRPGPVSGIVLSLIDIVLTLILKLSFNLFAICTYGFNWVLNMLFGNFKGVIPSSVAGGTVISMKGFRYLFTVLMPPFGVLLAKGIYGWFNVLVCMIITYVNFLAGIIYALVITARNRYADQYELRKVNNALSDKNNSTLENIGSDSSAFLGTCGFVILIGVVMFCFLSFF